MAFSTGRRSLTTFISRAVSHKLSPSPPSFSSSSRARFALAALAHPPSLFPSSTSLLTRFKSTGGHSPLDDPSPNWSNRPPKETILLDGCDYEHWLVVLEFPHDKAKPSDEEMINAYVKTLAEVVGSEEEAKKKIYSVSTTTYNGFGCLVSEELSYKLKKCLEFSGFCLTRILMCPTKIMEAISMIMERSPVGHSMTSVRGSQPGQETDQGMTTAVTQGQLKEGPPLSHRSTRPSRKHLFVGAVSCLS